eukprot:PhM_4_TR11597/c0_g1_i1/m.58165/K08857/NEK1_4_5; NIMA (never in mitosis gene a)-related kinase 1/4/5
MTWTEYERKKLLGSGSYGSVYLCNHVATGADVAVKVVAFTATQDSPELKAAITEVGILRTLNHENIVRYVDYFMDEEGHLCTVMEYADGGDLSAFMNAQDDALSLPEDILLDLMRQLLVALAYMARQNVIHRDLKPANVFLTRCGVVKIGDFGVSKMLTPSVTHARTFIGTPQYMSPEVCTEERYGHKSDVWSVGVLFYEIITGRLPFVARNLLALVNAVTKGVYDATPLKVYSHKVVHIVTSMLKSSADERPTAQELLDMHFAVPAIPEELPRDGTVSMDIPEEVILSQSAPSFDVATLLVATQINISNEDNDNNNNNNNNLNNHDMVVANHNYNSSAPVPITANRSPPKTIRHDVTWEDVALRSGFDIHQTARALAELVYRRELQEREENVVTVRFVLKSGSLGMMPDRQVDVHGVSRGIKVRSLMIKAARATGAIGITGFLFRDDEGDEIRIDAGQAWRYALDTCDRLQSPQVLLTVVCGT